MPSLYLYPPISAALLVAAFTAPLIVSADVRVVSAEPTTLFPKAAQLNQVANVTVWNSGTQAVAAELVATVTGSRSGPVVKVMLTPGSSQHRALVPDIKSPAEVEFRLAVAGSDQPLSLWKTQWQPQRKWKIFLIKSSHEDLGYEKLIYEKQRAVANNIDLAREISASPEKLGDGELPGYHYTLEHLMFQSSYIDERSEAQWRDVVEKDIKTGRMHLMGSPHGISWHWLDYEEIARATYPGRREAKDRFGLDLKTLIQADNPSLSWSGCQAAADAGFRYIARFDMGWRTGAGRAFGRTRLPAVFWWLAPDGKSRVLFSWRTSYVMSLWYGQVSAKNNMLIDLGSEHLSKHLTSIESGATPLGPYPYDALLNPEYYDHETPFTTWSVTNWAKSYTYPEIRMTNPTEFFEYIERKHGAELPVLSGDLNSFFADYATIDPESQGWKRRASRMLPLSEAIGAIAGFLNSSFQAPAALINRTFQRLFDYDEHCWPTLPQASDAQLFNAQWVKRNEAARALEGAQKALDTTFSEFSRQVPTRAESLLVFNPLAHVRSDIVEVAEDIAAVQDPATGALLPTQRVAGKTSFVARDVPALGYKVFLIDRRGGSAQPSANLSAAGTRLSNQYYEIRLDPTTGTIRSIYDKDLKRELVDEKADHRFNELVHVHKAEVPEYFRNPKDLPGDYIYSPVKAQSIESRVGPVKAELITHLADPKIGGQITQTVVLYDGLKRIDIINDLKAVSILHSDKYEDRYRENLYYAFPVKVDNFTPRVEYPGGVVRPYTDQMRYGSHDYLMANRWADVSNHEFGVTMAPWEAQTVSFGEIRYNKFSLDYKPANSHLYSYAWSNRMAGLLTFGPNDCNTTLHYSFTSHAGDWDSGKTTRFGWQVASPMVAHLLPAGQSGALPSSHASFLSISAPNVQATTLKQSEQPGRGWIVRLVETEGKASEVSLDLPMYPVAGAMECDLVENDRNALETTGRSVKLKIRPYGFATVRVFGSQSSPGRVENPQAEALSDQSIRLRWHGMEGAVYNVFRSEDPAAPPTAYSMVGRASGPEFTDDGLNLDTEYYYYVAAVTAVNLQGSVSEQLRCRTKKENNAPPRPVEELGVVRRAKDRLIVYWRKNTDPDVARLFVYRGERPDFPLNGSTQVAVVRPSGYFLETYSDGGLQPGKMYYYRVLAEDWSANRQTQSPTTQATTPIY